MSKRWTEKEDRILAFYGLAVGYDYVASHDLGRSPRAGTRRILWLRKNNPDLVAYEEAEMAKEGPLDAS